MKTKTRTLTLTAILVAITLLFGFTPIGYIQTPFGIVITLMCLPVIVGTLTLGWKAGLSLAALFALTSIAKIPTDVFGPTLLAYNPAMLMVNIIVPRLLIPFVVAFVYKAMRTQKEAVNIGVAAVAGSLTNTVLYLGFLYAFFSSVVAGSVILSVALLNGIIEAVVAALLCAPIVRALKKSVPALGSLTPLEKKKETT
ncbi:MAG: ECF transporter S component [Christensenella sp.]|uniref:ECF transporter S component n=1 Tax=Christensenella sp. TaxID=1935934 RepID=UPI002B2076C4|nr:ECF transporter S component [Christensenella sp.]MEA5001957.1 ECF transporter S component [Christensenella sp.]